VCRRQGLSFAGDEDVYSASSLRREIKGTFHCGIKYWSSATIVQPYMLALQSAGRAPLFFENLALATPMNADSRKSISKTLF
jgi:hypothetical protein